MRAIVGIAGVGLALHGITLFAQAQAQARATPASPAASLDVWPQTVAFYQQQLQQHGIVGSSLLVMKDGRIAGHATEGLQDRDARRAVDARTIYHWGSITKTFTGIAIMQLRNRGLLSLDDPIVKYVPELRQVHNPFGDMSAITIRHLMSHSSGFRNPTWGSWGGDKDWHPFEPPTWKQLDAMMPYTEILFPPGSKFSYSNPGIIYLGRTIEALTNEDYETYVTKNIFAPLGMHEAFFDRAPYHLVSHRSHSYYLSDDVVKEARFDFDTGITVSNGGLNAPLTDMAKYLAFLVGDPGDANKQAGYDIVLKRRSLEEMFRPQIPGAEPNVSLGLNFFLEKRGAFDLIGHSGSQGGFISHFYVHLPSRSGYVVAYNTAAYSKAKGDKQNTAALDAALRDYFVQHVFPVLAARPSSSAAAVR